MSGFTYGSAMAQQELQEIGANCTGCLAEPSQQLEDYQQAMGEVGQIGLGLVNGGELLGQSILKPGRLEKEAEDDRDEEASEIIVPQEESELDEWQDNLETNCELAANNGSEETSKQIIVKEEPEDSAGGVSVWILVPENGSKNWQKCDDKKEMRLKRTKKQTGVSLLKPSIQNKVSEKFDLMSGNNQFDSSARFLGLNRSKNLEGVSFLLCHQPGCAFKSWSKRKLDEHLLTHGVELSFPCEECGKTFKKRQLLRQHQRTVHEEKRFRCDYTGCGKKFHCQRRLKEHQSLVHDKLFLACPWSGCESRFANIQLLNSHRRRVHDKMKKVECRWSGCDRRFFNTKDMQIHYNLHCNKVKCKHPDCDMYFSLEANMIKHFVKQHQKKTK